MAVTPLIKQAKQKKTSKVKLASDYPWLVTFPGNEDVLQFKSIELAKVPIRKHLTDLRKRAELRSAEDLEWIDKALGALNGASGSMNINVMVDSYYGVHYRAQLLSR